DETLTTLPNAPAVVTGSASGVTQTSATLNATVNPNGGEVTECVLEYGTSTEYGSSVPCSPAPGSGSSAVAVSGAVTGLTANTTYHFRVSARNAGGTSVGLDQTLTTPNPPTETTPVEVPKPPAPPPPPPPPEPAPEAIVAPEGPAPRRL